MLPIAECKDAAGNTKKGRKEDYFGRSAITVQEAKKERGIPAERFPRWSRLAIGKDSHPESLNGTLTGLRDPLPTGWCDSTTCLNWPNSVLLACCLSLFRLAVACLDSSDIEAHLVVNIGRGDGEKNTIRFVSRPSAALIAFLHRFWDSEHLRERGLARRMACTNAYRTEISWQPS